MTMVNGGKNLTYFPTQSITIIFSPYNQNSERLQILYCTWIGGSLIELQFIVYLKINVHYTLPCTRTLYSFAKYYKEMPSIIAE